MVAMNFNANAVTPSYGGESGLPDGLYKTMIVKTEAKNSEKMGQVTGSYLELTHQVLEGPLRGQSMADRLNLTHSNPTVVEIANKQLSAYCHVLGQFNLQDSNQLCNVPMQIEVGRQIDRNTKQPTTFGEIKKIFDINGNEPGKQGQGGQQQQQQQQAAPPPAPPADVAPAGGAGWSQQAPQQQQQQQGFQQQQQAPQQQTGYPVDNVPMPGAAPAQTFQQQPQQAPAQTFQQAPAADPGAAPWGATGGTGAAAPNWGQ